MSILLTVREIPSFAGLPDGHTLIGFYFGTCNYPCETTMVTRIFWEALKKDCAFQIGEPIKRDEHLDGNMFASPLNVQ